MTRTAALLLLLLVLPARAQERPLPDVTRPFQRTGRTRLRAVLEGWRGVQDPVYAAAAAGDRLVLGGHQGLTVLDPVTGELLGWVSAGAPIFALSTSADGRRAATLAGAAGSTRIECAVWDLTVVPPRRLELADSTRVFRMALSPDGRSLAVVTREGALRVVDLETGRARTLAPAPGLGSPPGSVPAALAFTLDGATLVTAGLEVRLLDPTTGEVQATLPGARSFVGALVVGADRLVTIGPDGARLWDLPARREVADLPGVTAAAFSRDGQELVVERARPALVDLRSARDGRHLQELHAFVEEHLVALVFQGDDRLLVVGRDGTRLVPLDGTGPEPLEAPRSRSVAGLAVSDDGARVASAGMHSDAAVWSLRTGALERRVTLDPDGRGCAVRGVALTDDRLVLLDQDGRAGGWDLAGPADEAVWRVDHDRSAGPVEPAEGGARFVKDGALVVVGADGTEGRPTPLPAGLRPEAMTRDLRVLFGTENVEKTHTRVVRLVVGGEERLRFDPEGVWLTGLALSADGALAAVGLKKDHQVRLVRTATGELARELRLPGVDLTALALSPDGALLLTGDAGGLRLWETGGGEQVDRIPLEAVGDGPTELLFLRDGRSFVVGTERGAVLWFEVAEAR